MAVTLNDLAGIAQIRQNPAVADALGTSNVSRAFDQASKRIGQQQEQTQVQLSAYGQIQSGFANLQAAAKNLSNPKYVGTADDIQKAAQSFVDAYNTTRGSLDSALKGSAKTPPSLNNDGRASLASNDLRSVISTGSNVAELKKIGISIGQDGKLSLDKATLQSALAGDTSAVKKTLSNIGLQADQITTRELSGGGNVGRALDVLNTRAHQLEVQGAAQQKLISSFQTTVDQQSGSFSSISSLASIAAYLQTGSYR
jgi:flagellar capping protein FliD